MERDPVDNSFVGPSDEATVEVESVDNWVVVAVEESDCTDDE